MEQVYTVQQHCTQTPSETSVLVDQSESRTQLMTLKEEEHEEQGGEEEHTIRAPPRR